MLIEVILILDLFREIPIIIMVIPMVILLTIIIIGTPLILRITLKNFNNTIEENLNKIDDMSRSIDRISHDVECLKMKNFVPKVEESIKTLYVSMDEVRKEPLCLELKENF